MDLILHGARPERGLRLARTRLLIGFAQAIALTGVLYADRGGIWSSQSSFLFPMALMASLFLPVLWLSAAGSLSSRQVWRWMSVALLIMVALTAVDLLTTDGAQEDPTAFFVQTRLGQLVCGTGLLLYSVQVMVLAGTHERRWIASRARCLSCAVALALQLLGSFLVAVASGFAALGVSAQAGLRPCDVWPFIFAGALGFAGAMHLVGCGAPEFHGAGS
ncbi:hypothetical protein KTQ42_04360|uniref:hypothetical protein n=1 Tax=Noviherbaspirillum sp. L7-7A TaxID=2850560 RepID=UPI001C2BEC30|nr:hypothetical protein [Noviherbaspirillum sp. L7-7A]MBV0878532.1 hypothetical protein [Noviherbaspirillum sp. L7-7A]